MEYNVKKENVVDEGCITLWSSGHIYPYLVYKVSSGEIYVNTHFYQVEDGEYVCYRNYTRLLTRSMDEYKNITQKYFEKTVYGAWMDGAR